MKSEWKRCFAIPLLFVATALTSCNDDAAQSEPALKRGTRLLERGIPSQAEEAFDAVLAAEPGHAGAKLGRGLSRFLWLFDLGNWIGMLALGGNESHPKSSPPLFLAPLRATTPPRPTRDENDAFHGFLVGTFHQLSTLMTETEVDLAVAAESPGTLLSFERLPFKLNGKEIADLGGEWRASDARMAGIGASFFSGAFRLVLSQDLKTDYAGLFSFANQTILRALDEAREGQEDTGLAGLLNLFVFLVTRPDYPGFLTPSALDLDQNGTPDGGEAHLRLRENLLRQTQEIQDILRVKLEEADDPVKRPFGIHRRSAALGNTLVIGSGPKSIQVTLPAELDASLKKTAGHLRQHDPVQLSMKSDLAPMLAFAVTAFLKTGLLPIPADLTVLDTQIVQALFVGGLNRDIGLDVYALLSNPLNLRSFLPLARSDRPPDEINFLLEWECPAALAGAVIGTSAYFPGSGDLICGGGETLVDAPHFTDPIFSAFKFPSIEADGIPSSLPYLPFPDPTLGGFLYLEDESGLRPASLSSLNAFIAQFGPLVSGALGAPLRP
ncbi:MAG: hypothetical protein HYT87_08190 [Nitrospirae bacterium]|nr:hypothetical protein [Nitrospirota bacterium]